MVKKRSYPQLSGSYAPKSRRRYFSEELKRRRVRELEQGLVGVSELARSMGVSRSAIYKWLYKYSITYQRQEVMIVESKSEAKKVLLLKERIKYLEQMLGQKQIKLEFTEKMLELASEELGVDLKKKFGTVPYSGTGNEETKEDTK